MTSIACIDNENRSPEANLITKIVITVKDEGETDAYRLNDDYSSSFSVVWVSHPVYSVDCQLP